MYIDLKKLYYKYCNKKTINHYRLLVLTEEYRDIGINFYTKYPRATQYLKSDVYTKLFLSNQEIKKDFDFVSGKQSEIKNEFFTNLEEICKNQSNKDCYICSDKFIKLYVKNKYDYGKNTEDIIKFIIADIEKIEKLNNIL